MQDPGQGDLRHRHPPVRGQFPGAVEALEVALGEVAVGEPLPELLSHLLPVLARQPPGEEPTCQARPGEQRHPLMPVPVAVRGPVRPRQGQAVRPGRLRLHREAEVGAARGERDKPVLSGVLVGLGDAPRRPVGAAEGADAACRLVVVEDLDDRSDVAVRVVPVQQVQVDAAVALPRQGIEQVGGDVEWGDAAAVGVVMRPPCR